MTDCKVELLALLLLSLALLASLCLNVIFCVLRHKRPSCKDQNASRQGLQQDEEPDLGGHSNHTREEYPHIYHFEQDNPIYGNIITDCTASVVYEAMVASSSDRIKRLEPELNYASLDLKLAKKHKRKLHHQQGQALGQTSSPDVLPACLTPPENHFLGDVDICLPLRDNSSMVSHSSIYLNSQQLAQEAHELEQEDNEPPDWKTTGEERTEWGPEQESMDDVIREERENILMPDEQAIHSDTDHFSCTDGNQ